MRTAALLPDEIDSMVAGIGPKDTTAYDAQAALEEIRRILTRKGLLDPEEDLARGMLEDLVHYAYFTACINKAEVRELLGLSRQEAKERIRAWKKWHEGNRSCQLRQNPFYEEWPAEEPEPE